MAGGANTLCRPLTQIGLKWRRLLQAAALLLVLPQAVCAHGSHGHDSVDETELRIALEVNPKDLANRKRLATVLFQKKKLREAEREFAAALKLAPGDAEAHDGMGLVLMQERKYPEAASWFQRAIALKGDETMPHYHLGLAYEKMGRPREARTSYDRALAANTGLLRRGEHREAEQKSRRLVMNALQNLSAQKGGER